jgi:drug/metabolite transporter (DMT)-like permease
LALGVVCTGAAFVLYYRLINRIGGPRASTVTYLVPLFGVVWAWIVLGEQLTIRMAVAAICILGGVAVSQRS